MKWCSVYFKLLETLGFYIINLSRINCAVDINLQFFTVFLKTTLKVEKKNEMGHLRIHEWFIKLTSLHHNVPLAQKI